MTDWEKLVSFLESELPHAIYKSGTHPANPAGGGPSTTHFLRVETSNKIYDLRYSDSEVKQYADNNIFDGWIWIEVFEKYKGFLGINSKRAISFIRPQYHSDDGALIMPKDFSFRIKKAVVSKVADCDSERLERLEV